MKVLIHAGMPKTGSSSIQEHLYSHRDELADAGVIYPDFGHRAHWMLTGAFSRGDAGTDNRALRRIAGGKAELSLDEFMNRLQAGIASAADDQLLILSDEGMGHGARAKLLIAFIREIRPDAEISLLAYIRDPISHFPSATQQRLKAEGDNTLFPSVWISPHCLDGLYLQLALDVPILFRAFSPATLLNGDVVDDFRDVVERHTGHRLPGSVEPVRRNISHTSAGCAVIALRDLVPEPAFPTEYRNAFFRQIRATDTEIPTEKPQLPDSFRRVIAANNHEAWNLLVDLTEHDETTRQSLRMEAVPMPEMTEGANTGSWAIQGLRADYVAALARRLRASARKPDGPVLAAWLEAAIERVMGDPR